MKTVAFLYNVRHRYPDPHDPRSQLEVDFDDPETTRWQIKHLKSCGFRVIPIEANETAYIKLYRLKKEIDLVFNASEGIYGHDREAQIPAMLEMLQIPYTGSSPLTQSLVLDKAKTKEVLRANHVPTLPFQLLTGKVKKIRSHLSYPLIVKPVSEGSGAGISNKSVVHNLRELNRQIYFILKTFHGEPALAEAFLTGPEYSIAMLGNPPQILPIISPDHSILPKHILPMDSLEVKWIFEEQDHRDYLRCPAPIERKTRLRIERICLAAWKALNIKDWCRIDLRFNDKGRPYILEVNSPPGILPPEISQTSYFPLAARAANISYDNLLKEIVSTTAKRYGISMF